MPKGFFLGLAVLVAVAVAAFVLIQGAGKQKTEVGQESSGASQKVPAPESPETPEMIVSGEPNSAQKEIAVSGDEYSFSPSSISVANGETVKITFKNMGNLPHNLTIAELGVATKTISAGQEDSVMVMADKTGTYAFYCAIGNHRQQGMEGKLEVK